jgi:hypothetical protein
VLGRFKTAFGPRLDHPPRERLDRFPVFGARMADAGRFAGPEPPCARDGLSVV